MLNICKKVKKKSCLKLVYEVESFRPGFFFSLEVITISLISQNPNLKLLHVNERITPENLYNDLRTESPPILLDVRSPLEFQICNIFGSINIPLNDLSKPESQEMLEAKFKEDANNLRKGIYYMFCKTSSNK